jgi:hypothetical protein
MWYYAYPDRANGYVMDDCYYLYDQEGVGSVVERDGLKGLIGDDLIIARFNYNEHIGFDK